MPELNELQLEACARAGYEAFITVNHDTEKGALPHWEKLSRKARRDYMDDAADYIAGMTLEQLHEKHLAIFVEQGWTYAPVRDLKKKQAPEVVHWDQLNFVHRSNDYIVSEIVKTMARLFEELNSPAWGAISPEPPVNG